MPLAVVIAGANRPDYQLARDTLLALAVDRPAPTARKPQGLCLDRGYDHLEVWELLEEFGFTAHIAVQGRRPRRSNAPPERKPAAGSSNAPTAG